MSRGWRGRGAAVLLASTVAYGLLASVSQAFDARGVEPSVYKIYSFVPGQDDHYTVSSGTGFLVSGRRYLVTNFHVIEGGEHFYVGFRHGEEAKMIEARRIDGRPSVDLALLEVQEDLPGDALTIGEYEPDKLADVVAIGFPGAANLNHAPVPSPEAQAVPLTDLDSTLTTGVVSRMTFTNLTVSPSQTLSVRTVQHSSAINPGNSGGPLLDACGMVVGVNTLQGLNSQGLFFSVHAGEVARFLRDLGLPFSSTTRPCTAGASSGLVPLAVALTVALALGAVAVMLRARVRSAAHVADHGNPNSVQTRSSSRSLEITADTLYLRPVSGGTPIPLPDKDRPLTIGRGPGADIVVSDDAISKVHARIACDRTTGRVRITDLASSNGIFIDGTRITEATISAGALLRLGTTAFKLAYDDRALLDPERRKLEGDAWMLSGFDASGRAIQFELRPAKDPASGKPAAASWAFGRDPARADFAIDDTSVSALHAEIRYDPGQSLVLRDLGSMNGTRLDGVSIGDSTANLSRTGHEIAFGLAVLRLSRLAA